MSRASSTPIRPRLKKQNPLNGSFGCLQVDEIVKNDKSIKKKNERGVQDLLRNERCQLETERPQIVNNDKSIKKKKNGHDVQDLMRNESCQLEFGTASAQ